MLIFMLRIISENNSQVLVSASTLEKEVRDSRNRGQILKLLL